MQGNRVGFLPRTGLVTFPELWLAVHRLRWILLLFHARNSKTLIDEGFRGNISLVFQIKHMSWEN